MIGPRAFIIIGPNYELGEYYCRAIDSETRQDAVGFGWSPEVAKAVACRLLSDRLDNSQKRLDSEHTM